MSQNRSRFLKLVHAALSICLAAGLIWCGPALADANLSAETIPSPKLDLCSHGGLSMAAYYDPVTLEGKLAYRRDGGWNYLTLGELDDYLAGTPLALDCTSYSLADGTIRTMLSYIGMNKDKGFGVFAYELDFPAEGGPTARIIQSPIFTHSSMLPPVDVAAGDVAYDIKAGRILAAVVRGKRFGYFTLKASEPAEPMGISEDDTTWNELDGFDKDYSSGDEDKPQVDLAVNQSDEDRYITFTDPEYNNISYWDTAEGFSLHVLLESNPSRPIIQTAASENGHVATYTATPPDKGLWALWSDSSGQVRNFQVSDQQVVNQSVTRYTYNNKDYIVVAYEVDVEGSDINLVNVAIIDPSDPSAMTTTEVGGHDTINRGFKVEVRSFFGSEPQIVVGHTMWNTEYLMPTYDEFDPVYFPR